MPESEARDYYPQAHPRAFLEERIERLRVQAELDDPGGPHYRVREFEEFGERFLAGTTPPETLCLYAMTLFLENQDKLAGTDAAVNLLTFPSDFAQYVPISEERIYELWNEDARYIVEVANPRMRRVQEYRNGTRTFPFITLKIEEGMGPEDTKEWYPGSESTG